MLDRTTLATASCLAVSLFAAHARAQLGIKIANNTNANIYLEAKYDKTLVPQTGLTVEAWITYDGTNLGPGFRWPTICRQNLAPNSESFVFRVDAGNNGNRFIKIAVRTALGFRTVGYAFAPNEFATWTHVAGTFDGQTIKFFVNAVEKASFQLGSPTTLRDTGGELRIGCGDTTAAAGAENWDGEIDEVRLWPYARTAAEIKSTMALELSSIPGEVSTWNLNFNGNDSSGNNNLTAVNNPTFGVNTNRLTGANWTSTLFGSPTTGCGDTPAIGASSTANIGNGAFALTCVHAAKNPGSAGFAVIGFSRLINSIPIGNANLWVNPNPSLLVPTSLNDVGFARLGLPIPNSTPLIGANVFCQMAFAQQGCASVPYSSAGLQTKITQ